MINAAAVPAGNQEAINCKNENQRPLTQAVRLAPPFQQSPAARSTAGVCGWGGLQQLFPAQLFPAGAEIPSQQESWAAISHRMSQLIMLSVAWPTATYRFV